MTTGPWRRPPSGPDLDPGVVDRCVAAAFADVAEERMEAVALIDSTGEHSYGVLSDRLSAIAAVVDEHAVGPSPVGVLAGHDADAVASMLGVARAGRSFLVLDPYAPSAYRAQIVARHGVSAVIAATAHRSEAAMLAPEAMVIDLGAVRPTASSQVPVDPGQSVAVWSTSGTSGRPKAVVHSHRNVLHNALRFSAAIDAVPDDRFLATLPYPFVASGTPTFAALLSGATAVVHDIRQPGSADLLSVAQEHQATIVFLTAGLITSMAGAAGGRTAHGVRLVVTGGDRLSAEQVRTIRARFPEATLLHRYNTSETNWVAGLVIEPETLPAAGSVPIGWPMPWVQADLVDASGSVVVGVGQGEIAVRGEHLALGYLDDPDLTAERFATLADGREYRTGDLASRGPDGMLSFLGRGDATVKVRDVLVDPARVEEVIESCEGVRAAAVVPWQAPDGATRLSAFVAARGTRAHRIRQRLLDRLPLAMMPATIEIVLDLPLTAMGKVDTALLAARAAASPRADYVEPRSPEEERLAAIFARILGVDKVGRDDDFLALGADSLAVAELVVATEHELGRSIEISSLLAHPTPAGLAALAGTRPLRSRRDSHLVEVCRGAADRPPVLLFPGAGGHRCAGHGDPGPTPRQPDRRHVSRGPSSIEVDPTGRSRPWPGAPSPTGGPTDRARTPCSSACRPVATSPSRRPVSCERPESRSPSWSCWTPPPDPPNCRRAGRCAEVPAARSPSAHRVRARRGQGTSVARRAYWVSRLALQRGRSRLQAVTVNAVPPSSVRRASAMFQVVRQALLAYEQPVYDGDVLLVRATDLEPGHSWGERLDLRWGSYVTGRLQIATVPCRHEEARRPSLRRHHGRDHRLGAGQEVSIRVTTSSRLHDSAGRSSRATGVRRPTSVSAVK